MLHQHLLPGCAHRGRCTPGCLTDLQCEMGLCRNVDPQMYSLCSDSTKADVKIFNDSMIVISDLKY